MQKQQNIVEHENIESLFPRKGTLTGRKLREFIPIMILTNMSNIFLTRKKTELTIMRVNGFSIKQTKGYLTKETVMTTVTGLILGVLIGIWVAPRITAQMQQPDLEFVKSFHPVPWLIAVGLESAFAVIISAFVFRKVKDLDLKDIS